MRFKITFLMILICAFSFAQNEFITVWQPSKDSNISIKAPSTNNQIIFPGIGNNYNIRWEEVGNPSHYGTLTNVNSPRNYPVLIDFGTGITSEATYIVKVSNGNGIFSNIECGDGDYKKLLEIKQWGNIKWSTMRFAFENCTNLDVTANDTPDFSSTTDLSFMFYWCTNLKGNSSFGYGTHLT